MASGVCGFPPPAEQPRGGAVFSAPKFWDSTTFGQCQPAERRSSPLLPRPSVRVGRGCCGGSAPHLCTRQPACGQESDPLGTLTKSRAGRERAAATPVPRAAPRPAYALGTFARAHPPSTSATRSSPCRRPRSSNGATDWITQTAFAVAAVVCLLVAIAVLKRTISERRKTRVGAALPQKSAD